MAEKKEKKKKKHHKKEKKEKKKKKSSKKKHVSDAEVKLLDDYDGADEEALVEVVDKGEKQPTRCRDFIAAALFVGHLVAIFVIALKDGYPAIERQNSLPGTHSFQGILTAATIMSIISIFIGVALIRLMLNFGKSLIKFLLFFSFGVGGVLVATGSSVNIFSSVIGIIVMLVCLVYGKMVWSRIPLANENLGTALICLKQNFGVFYLVFAYCVIAFTYTLLWVASFIGARELSSVCPSQGGHSSGPNELDYYDLSKGNTGGGGGGGGNNGGGQGGNNGGQSQGVICETNTLFYIPYILAYIWSFQVVTNCVTVLVSGVVGCWWSDPDGAHGCVSSATKKAFTRSLTTEFGSICWGALLSPYVQVINEIINPDGDMTTGITECFPKKCVKGFESLVENFSQWGYIYVGIYGYGFGDGSRRALAMFRRRHWEPVTSDHLLRNIFILSIVVVSYIMSQIGKVVAGSSDFFIAEGNSGTFIAEVMGAIIGGVFGAIMIAALTGSILAVVVLFAERRDELDEHHPEIYDDMMAAYEKAYPNLFR